MIEAIVARYTYQEGAIRRQDAEDVIAVVHLRVITKLRGLAEAAETEVVASLEDYVATLTFNTLHDHLRRRYPERTRLKNRLRYVLTRDARLAIWLTPTGAAAGLKRWSGRTDPVAFTAEPTLKMRNRDNPADAVYEMLRAAGQPVLLDSLVNAAAELWGITDAQSVRVASTGSTDAAVQLENREFLRSLWREILLLPAAQRKALLLNLRDAETVNVASLLAVTGTAGLEEIAAAMEMTNEELAGIWNDLPLDDLRIASMLGLTRQQVINLRKSARQRLARRMGTRK